MRYSANLGFLFTDLALPDAIRAAHAAGFDAVECHFPYATPAAEVAAALAQTGMAMLGLNTHPGDRGAGDFGLAALPGREEEARAAIAQAVAYAAATGTRAVHVMAGVTDDPRAGATFAANLAFACDCAAPHGITVLIEPLNPRDVPGYHLLGADHAARVIADVGRDALRLMFDCYHLQITGGDLLMRFRALRPLIGHVQFAGVPDRGDPSVGEVDYSWLLPRLAAEGWDAPFGAEYRPAGATGDSLGWLSRWR
ncbi:hydroxypyruvate isomerase family protein [Rhodobaculum claviforme]|uniref:Isomerase n=1 Tax=Rhodobaculum claviforme TaxID=1549854 RepID=A0A934WHK6_9RHOB|nr:TIM barrel protein [Rhodobaculum claviforme]MBK5925951.1 isomerase [Rhodobaculum claviforme]